MKDRKDRRIAKLADLFQKWLDMDERASTWGVPEDEDRALKRATRRAIKEARQP